MRNFSRILKTLFNTSAERHAFIIGFSETIAIRHSFVLPWLKNYDGLRDEYHYYMAGRAVGVLAWVGIAIGLIKMFWR